MSSATDGHTHRQAMLPALCLLIVAGLVAPAAALPDHEAALRRRPSPEIIHQQIERILAQERYQTEDPGEPWWHQPLLKLLRRLTERFDQIGQLRDDLYAGYPLLYWAVVVMLAVALVGIVVHMYLGLHGLFDTKRRPRRTGKTIPEDIPSGNLPARARQAASAGQFGQAIIYLYLAAVWHLDGRGLIAFNRADTNRQILWRLRDQPEVTVALGPLSEAVEAISYGNHRPDGAEFERAMQQAQAVMAL